MPTSCCVVGCTNRHCKDAPYRFYRFPKDSSRRQRWIAAVRRVNIDGSAWQPSAGDRVCSLHFVSGEKNDNPTHPGYVPTLNMTGEVITEGASTATEQSVSRVERLSAREDRKRHQFEEKAAEVASISALRRFVSIEHSYPCVDSESIWEPPTKLAKLNGDSVSLPSLQLESTG